MQFLCLHASLTLVRTSAYGLMVKLESASTLDTHIWSVIPSCDMRAIDCSVSTIFARVRKGRSRFGVRFEHPMAQCSAGNKT